jgi:probable rRNA maturation factor
MSDDPDQAATVEIDLDQRSPQWLKALPQAARIAETAARAALRGSGRTPQAPAELAIVLGDDALLRELNRTWRGQDKPTNVLSFPAGDAAPAAPGAPVLLGDVVIAFETLASEAASQQKPLAAHLAHLVVHGVLHLLGFGHEEAAEAARMEALETRLLAGIGVPDPYRVREASHG